MKIALCLSGQPRGLKQSLESIKRFVIDGNDCDVFVHCWIDENIRGKPFRIDTPHDIFHSDTERFIIDNYSPKLFEFQDQLNFTKVYRDSPNFPCFNHKTSPMPWFNIQSMFYSMMKSDLLRQSYEKSNDFKYDCVIRCRFDYIFLEKMNFQNFDMNFLNTKSDCTHTHYAINDHIAFGSSDVMKYYSSVFNSLDMYYNQGIEFNGEVLLGYHAMMSGLQVAKTIDNDCCRISTTEERRLNLGK